MTRLTAVITAIWCGLASLGFAQSDAGRLAEAAKSQLDAASLKLDAADSARDRVQALTDAIVAYERGLEALREGLRAVSLRQDQLERSLNARNADIAALLAALQSIQPDRLPTAFLHPEGPVGTARASVLLSSLTPALNSSAMALRQDVDDLKTLRLLQEQAVAQLETGLRDLQTARLTLNQAMANRTDLPTRFTEDPVKLGVLIASSETLGAFSGGLSQITADDTGWSPPDLSAQKGALDWPARGVILRKPGEADAAGITRPGVLLATREGAIVTSPTAATIRYKGPLLDLGEVMILELRPDLLMVLSGLGVSYGAAGQIITPGTALGLMGDAGLTSDTAVLDQREGAGTVRPETLYIEIRDQNVPQDPMEWFGTGEDG